MAQRLSILEATLKRITLKLLGAGDPTFCTSRPTGDLKMMLTGRKPGPESLWKKVRSKEKLLLSATGGTFWDFEGSGGTDGIIQNPADANLTLDSRGLPDNP